MLIRELQLFYNFLQSQKNYIKLMTENILISQQLKQQEKSIKTMIKCKICSKQVSMNELSTENSSHQVKRSQIQSLRQEIQQKRLKYNQMLQRKFGKKQAENTVIIEKIEQIAKKQQKQKQIIYLRKKLTSVKELLFQKKQCNMKNALKFRQAEEYWEKINEEYQIKSQQNLDKLSKVIQIKKKNIIQLSKRAKKYIKEVIVRDMGTILQMYRVYRIRQSEKLLEIKKVDELDFMTNDKMAQSFYELQNIEEIAINRQTSEKTLHVFYQNILIFELIRNIFNFWIPYPINNCQFDFNSSKTLTKPSAVTICGEGLIDFTKTTKLSNNIIQIFNAEESLISVLNQEISQSNKHVQQIKREFDESIEYNKKRYALNKNFLNCFQTNLDFLAIKHQLSKRPFVFFEQDLIKIIQKQYIQDHFYDQKVKQKPQSIQKTVLDYKSMFKQKQLSKLLTNLEKCKGNKKNLFQQPIEQVDAEQSNEIETEIKNTTNQSISQSKQSIISSYFNTFSQYFNQSFGKKTFDIPDSLQTIKSNSSDNQEFQVLNIED